MRGRAARGGESGAALVELAFVLPMLVLLTVGTVDFARVFYIGMVLTNAARAGAQYGGQTVGRSTDTAGMAAAANAVLSANGYSGALVTTPGHPGFVCDADDASSLPTPTTLPTWTPASTCPANYHMVLMVQVTVQKTFNVLASSILPSSLNSLVLKRTVVFRVAN